MNKTNRKRRAAQRRIEKRFERDHRKKKPYHAPEPNKERQMMTIPRWLMTAFQQITQKRERL